ncbi:hypothetical protein ES332_D04G022500v1 [Gossypium tomentosum]|uniref:Uncharacterized protein n=1 Tax=Gossypium tomentosum TaxID=34277 RepID=A0A5D2LBE7_GOSTO|nr:hypothetical protein ES332_D04G022500v1 [Gossypium tomentosum]
MGSSVISNSNGPLKDDHRPSFQNPLAQGTQKEHSVGHFKSILNLHIWSNTLVHHVHERWKLKEFNMTIRLTFMHGLYAYTSKGEYKI